MTVERDPKVWLPSDDVRCVGQQCERASTCARARSPRPKQYASVEDFGREVAFWRACWLAITADRRNERRTHSAPPQGDHMSGWRIAVNALYAAGGGPLPARLFGAERPDLRRAKELGLLRLINGTHWQLTAEGRSVAEGRAAVVEHYATGSGRRGTRIVATWLSALPRPNAIRLTGAIPFTYD